MMRRSRLAIFSFGALLAAAALAFPQGNPRGFTDIYLGGHQVSVFYGRPSLKGRTITALMSQLKPGQFWRLGADESTIFTTLTGLKFGNVTVPRGTYSIWAEREAGNSWKLVFNHQYGQWGTDHNTSKDFASIPLKETKTPSTLRTMMIILKKEATGGVFIVRWGDMELSAHFTPTSS